MVGYLEMNMPHISCYNIVSRGKPTHHTLGLRASREKPLCFEKPSPPLLFSYRRSLEIYANFSCWTFAMDPDYPPLNNVHLDLPPLASSYSTKILKRVNK